MASKTKEFIIKFFIINLECATRRKECIIKLCEQYHLNYEIVQAVNGRELKPNEYEAIIQRDKMERYHKRELGLGEIGCTLSHKKCYQKIIEENLPFAVILEDDAIFNDRLLKFLDHQDQFPKNLELLLLGHQRQVYNDDGFKIHSPHSRRFCKEIIGVKIRRLVGRGNGTYGYFITQKGAKRLLEHLERIYLPIDAMTSSEDFVNIYAVFPTLVNVNPDFMLETSTQDNIDIKKRRSRVQKVFKKWHIFFKFLIPSFRALKEYQ